MPFKPNIPSSPHAHKGPHALKDLQDDPQGRQDFLKIMEQEDALIYREIKPDYLTLINEPETAINRMLHLTFSADELADWVGEVTTHLKSTGASPNTLLGAGAVTWEPEEFVLKFAKQTNLDYVDIHMYSIGLKLQGKDQVAKLATLVRKIREARPNMRITIGETWLLKLGAGDMGPKVTTYQEIFQRNNFSFWSPLDEQFLALLMGIAQKENISVVAPFFSQYFFTYYTFGDAESSKLPPWPWQQRSLSLGTRPSNQYTAISSHQPARPWVRCWMTVESDDDGPSRCSRPSGPSRRRNMPRLWRGNRTRSGGIFTNCCGIPARRKRTRPVCWRRMWTGTAARSAMSGSCA